MIYYDGRFQLRSMAYAPGPWYNKSQYHRFLGQCTFVNNFLCNHFRAIILILTVSPFSRQAGSKHMRDELER